MAHTHYETLGVSPACKSSDIRTAYRRLVLKHHPDQSSNPNSAQILMQIRKAYEVLIDPAQRKQYDATLEMIEQGARPSPPPPKAPEKARRQRPRAEPSPKQSPLTQELTRLAALFHRGRFAEAEELAMAITQTNPREPLPYAVRGDIARAKGDISKAIDMYGRAWQAAPSNALYQRLYEEMVANKGGQCLAKPTATPGEQAAVVFGGAVVLISCVYIALSRETALLPSLSLVNTWTLGLVVMLFLCGVTAGATLAVGGKVDRFGAASFSSLGRIAPAMALGTVAVVSFWAAAALYAVLGFTQNAFNYSTSRIMSWVGGIVCLSSLAAAINGGISPAQVFLWGGNLSYIGALCGWLVADSLRVKS